MRYLGFGEYAAAVALCNPWRMGVVQHVGDVKFGKSGASFGIGVLEFSQGGDTPAAVSYDGH